MFSFQTGWTKGVSRSLSDLAKGLESVAGNSIQNTQCKTYCYIFSTCILDQYGLVYNNGAKRPIKKAMIASRPLLVHEMEKKKLIDCFALCLYYCIYYIPLKKINLLAEGRASFVVLCVLPFPFLVFCCCIYLRKKIYYFLLDLFNFFVFMYCVI